MNAKYHDILPSIRTLPLPDDESKALFSRAVRVVQQQPADFAAVGKWLNKHYCEARLRALCERKYRQDFAYRLRLLRLDSHTYNRRLAIQSGRPLDQVKRERIGEAHTRGQRLKQSQLVTRSHPDAHPDEKPIDESNVHLVFAWEDHQYRRRFRQIKAERRAAKLGEYDHPDKPGWRLARAVVEIIEAGYPADTPTEHIAQSRKIVALASLLVWPEALLMLGEFGRWEWGSNPDWTWEGNPFDLMDDFWRNTSQPPVQDGAHNTPLHLLHARIEGREEVLFHRMPGERRELQHQWGNLSSFLALLRVAVDELEAERKPADTAAKLHATAKGIESNLVLSVTAPPAAHGAARTRAKLPKNEANIKARDFLRKNPHATVRELAAGIGCSTGLVSQLAAWEAVQEQRRKQRQPKKAAIVSLTSKLQRVAGTEDETLAKLIGEQEADSEPSPLEDDPRSGRQGTPRKARVYSNR